MTSRPPSGCARPSDPERLSHSICGLSAQGPSRRRPAGSDEAELAFVARVVDREVAGRAPPPGLQRRAAGGVADAFAAAGHGPPLRQQGEHTGQLPPGLGQLVAEPGRTGVVGGGDQQPVSLEPLEALRQDVGGDARQGLGELAEPQRSGEERMDDEQRPPVADPGRRPVERRRGRIRPALIAELRPAVTACPGRAAAGRTGTLGHAAPSAGRRSGGHIPNLAA
jgi:hypothetical protein